jgi:hypothetical protein
MSFAGLSISYLGENSEPRPRETAGALVFGWPPEGAAPVQVGRASHEPAAVVQRLAESRWRPNLSFFTGVSVATKAVECLSSSASRVTADSATAVKRAGIKPVCGSAANTATSIRAVSRDDRTMQTGNGLFVDAKRRSK